MLKARGLNVVALFGKYGEERDRAIAHAKLVLNVHFYETKVFEMVRAAYLFSNAKAVIAECGADTSVDPDLREAICGVPYDGLVDACVELLREPVKRLALGERAHRIFARRREEDILAVSLGLIEAVAVTDRAIISNADAALPATLHLGSGKDFKPECFNVDINPAWRPDAVLDIASPTLLGSSLATSRFGRITLQAESFEGAIANDVLEHMCR